MKFLQQLQHGKLTFAANIQMEVCLRGVFDYHRNYNDHIRTGHGLRGERYLALKLVDKRGRTAAEQKELEETCDVEIQS
ncbi:hypothetical protein LTR67_004311 [Exophiala xenobiotica]